MAKKKIIKIKIIPNFKLIEFKSTRIIRIFIIKLKRIKINKKIYFKLINNINKINMILNFRMKFHNKIQIYNINNLII
jgi:hypothetical protein